MSAPGAMLRGKRVEGLLLGGVLLLFVALGGFRAAGYVLPYYDDVGYLELGQRVRDLGGPGALLRELYAGRFTEANRHPLYAALLSLVAAPEPGYHRRAQVLALALGALALLACYLVGRRHLGGRTALILSALLATNLTFLDHGSRESCELLLIAVWIPALGAMLDGAERPGRFLRAGLFAGVAYLCKGSGILLLPVAVLALLLHRTSWRARLVSTGWLALGFLVTASPLLVRNFRLFGSPFHNANTHLLWSEPLPDFAEVFAPGASVQLGAGPLEYLQQTTMVGLLGRFGRGLVETAFHLADAMSPTAPTIYGPIHLGGIVVGCLGALAAVVLLVRGQRGFARTLLLCHLVVCFAFFVFYNAASGSSRYLLPLAVTLLAVLARELQRRREPLRAAAALLVLAVALTLALDRSPRSLPPGFAEAQSFLATHLRTGEGFAIDSRSKLQPQWLIPRARQVIVSASLGARPVAAEVLMAHFRERGVRFIILDATSRASRGSGDVPERRRFFFYDRLPLQEDGSLPVAGFPAGLRVAWASAPRSPLLLILETPWSARR